MRYEKGAAALAGDSDQLRGRRAAGAQPVHAAIIRQQHIARAAAAPHRDLDDLAVESCIILPAALERELGRIFV